MRHVEVSEAGKARLADELGLQAVAADEALDRCEVVILAVPDTAIGKVASAIVNRLKPGTMVIVLDAAATLCRSSAGARRSYLFRYPSLHPPIFNDETDPAAKRDFFGGVAAKQHIVSALMQGPEEAYALGEEIAKVIWAPVMRSHRVTVEQLRCWSRASPKRSAPRCWSSCVRRWRSGVKQWRPERGRARLPARPHERARRRDLRRDARRFLRRLHKAIEFGKPMLMREDWKRVFEPQEIADSIRRIT